MSHIRLLVVGTGGMARNHAQAFQEMQDVTIVACVDPNELARTTFQQAFSVEQGFPSVEDALRWGRFDAATNVTPDAFHHQTTLPLLDAGKHVLCEKPLASNAPDAEEMAQAAQRAGVVNMVNLTYRKGGALIEAEKLVRHGAIGAVRHFEASYLQSWLTQPAWGDWRTQDQWLWRLSQAHGSMGVLGDVGVHIVDFASHISGAGVARVSCRLKTFEKARGNQIGPYVLDANDSFAMHVELSNGATGVIHASRFASGHRNDLSMQIFGTKGGLEVFDKSHQSKLRASIGTDIEDDIWRDIDVADGPQNYEKFIASIRSGHPADPSFATGARLQKVLDRAVQSAQAGCVDMVV